jgi:hypothetical protein
VIGLLLLLKIDMARGRQAAADADRAAA